MSLVGLLFGLIVGFLGRRVGFVDCSLELGVVRPGLAVAIFEIVVECCSR